MKRSFGLFVLAVSSGLLLILVSCQSFDNSSDDPEMIDVVFNIDAPRQSGSSAAPPGRTDSRNAYVNTVVISVVSATTTAADIDWNLSTDSSALMDLTSNTISLKVSYDTPFKLLYVSIFGTYTLEQALSQQPGINYWGLSEPITIASGTSTQNVAFSLTADKWQGTMQFGGTGSDLPTKMVLDSNNNIYVAGETSSNLSGTNQGGDDAFVAKFDEDGNQLWIAQTGSSLYDHVYGIALDSTEDVYVIGTWHFDSADYTSADYFVIKYDKDTGTALKTLILGDSNQGDLGRGITIDASDNVYVVGMTAADGTLNGASKPDTAGKFDVFVSRYTPGLSHVWTKFVDSSGDFDDYAAGIDTCAMGNIYITGETKSVMPLNPSGSNTYDGSGDGFIAMLDSSGVINWIIQFGGVAEEEPTAIAVGKSTANIFVAGRTHSNLDGNTVLGSWDAFVTSYSSAGSKRWTTAKWIATTGSEEPTDIKLDLYEYVYVVGYTSGSLPGNTNAGGVDGFLYRFDSSGTPTTLSRNQFGDTTDDALTALAVDNDRNMVIAGGSFGQLSLNWTHQGGWDSFILKLDASGDEL
jgi:beta-propeller repeat-containing protein